MMEEEIKVFLNMCRVDPKEKITTSDDSWWTLEQLIMHWQAIQDLKNNN